MEVDADGGPHAYAAEGSGLHGLDFIGNAKNADGKWVGVVCDPLGKPYVQGPKDPAPGFLVTETALQDHTKKIWDPLRYVNAEVTPYVSIPRDLTRAGGRLGDLCEVAYRGVRCLAICADIGPSGKIGEGSIALCQTLGVDPFRGIPKHHLLGIGSGVSFRLLLGTAMATAWPRAFPFTV